MRHKLFSAGCMVAIAVIGAAPAHAQGNNKGNMCGFSTPISTNNATLTPGNSATSPGSTHNEGGINSVNGGKGGTAYNNAGAPSNYDTSCAKVTANGTGTPAATGPTGSPIPQTATNNAKATRPISHTGKG